MIDRISKDLSLLLVSILGIGALWQGLEWLLYGEVQHRRVDDIITFVWISVAVGAYVRGYLNGRENA